MKLKNANQQPLLGVLPVPLVPQTPIPVPVPVPVLWIPLPVPIIPLIPALTLLYILVPVLVTLVSTKFKPVVLLSTCGCW